MMQNVAYGRLPLYQAVSRAFEQAHIAVEIDPDDGDAQAIMAFALWTNGDFDEAWRRAELAIASNPNSSWANGIKAALLIFGGQPNEGRNAALGTLRLSPHDPRDAHLRSQIAISYYLEQDYINAAEAARHAISRHPEHPLAYRWLAAALGQLGQAAEALDV